jgi:hypothetical protein
MTLEECMATPQTVTGRPRPMTVDEWRAANGYSNPLDDHGDFRHPNGISKATKKRILQRVQERGDSMQAGAEAYAKAKEAGAVPLVHESTTWRADGLDFDSAAAKVRLRWKRANRSKATRPIHLTA